MTEKSDTTQGVSRIWGMIGEFENPAALLAAAEKLRDSGYKEFDCHSPFSIHGMDEAMGLTRSPLGFIIAIIAFFAMIGGLALQWYANAYDYPLVISGKPFISYQAYAPVGFGLTVLSAAICTFIIMLALNGLPKLFHPLFFSERFPKFSDDCFFVSIEKSDPKFDVEKTKQFLDSIGSQNVETLKG